MTIIRGSRALDQARLEWVCRNSMLVHHIYELAEREDKTAMALRDEIYDTAKLRPGSRQLAKQHVRSHFPDVDLSQDMDW